LSMYLEDLYTIPANMGWLPAMSVPAGMLEDQWENMPVGLQIMANRREEEKLFALGTLMESFDW
jgi:aspartyl-tRNA(Asn)/glutamyl-tRNA(Gln) amidotransferase subunit A